MIRCVKMKLQEKYYDFIRSGTKRIELRLYDEKRRSIQLGDEILFLKNDNNDESVRVKVIGLLRYECFEKLLQDFNIEILADKSVTKEELLEDLNKFYSKKAQEECGIVGIRFELIDEDIEIVFYKGEREDINISITISLNDGKLRLDGYEYGTTVDRLRGVGHDHEYSLTFDKENTDKLFKKLGIMNKTGKQKLEAVRNRFSKDKGIFGLDDYCGANGIETFYYS